MATQSRSERKGRPRTEWSDATRLVHVSRSARRARIHADSDSLRGAVEETMAALEGAERVRIGGVGACAVAPALLALLAPGDHLLIPLGASLATRRFCAGVLSRFGVATSEYDPRIGAGVDSYFRADTRLVLIESQTQSGFAFADVAAIASAARRAGVWSLMDNDWASPIGFKPLAQGVDLSVASLDRLAGGALESGLASVAAAAGVEPALERGWRGLGRGLDAWQARALLDALPSLPARLDRRRRNAETVAEWLRRQPETAALRCPSLPTDLDHELWARDYREAGARLGLVLRPDFATPPRLRAFLDSLALFDVLDAEAQPLGMEASAIQPGLRDLRAPGPTAALALTIGLEDPLDLIDDLSVALSRLRAA